MRLLATVPVILLVACSSSPEDGPPRSPAWDAGADVTMQDGPEVDGADDARKPFEYWTDCSLSGDCTLVQYTCSVGGTGRVVVASDRVGEFFADECPGHGEECVCRLASNEGAFPFFNYGQCFGGMACSIPNEPPPPPDGWLCPATTPTAGQSCEMAARCEYDDDPRIPCRETLDCASAGNVWVDITRACTPMQPCPSGVTHGAPCTDTDAACIDGADSCHCEGWGDNVTWFCFGPSIRPGCPAAAPRLGSSCASVGTCCDYAIDAGMEINVARECAGAPSVWIELPYSQCLD